MSGRVAMSARVIVAFLFTCVLGVCSCKRTAPTPAPREGDPDAVATIDAAPPGTSVVLESEGKRIILSNAIAEVGLTKITIFISSKAITCMESFDTLLHEDGVRFEIPPGLAGDFYRDQEVGLEAWILEN